LLACGCAALAILFIHLLFRNTRFGKAIRAAAQEPWGAYLVGVNVKVFILSVSPLGFAELVTCPPSLPARLLAGGLVIWSGEFTSPFVKHPD
jgi:predicted ABC-type sugar transport system permease subunit